MKRPLGNPFIGQIAMKSLLGYPTRNPNVINCPMRPLPLLISAFQHTPSAIADALRVARCVTAIYSKGQIFDAT